MSKKCFYKYGLYATDIKYPEPGDPHFHRWEENMYRVTTAPYGFTVAWQWSVDACDIKRSMMLKYQRPLIPDVGLILCEQPNQEGRNQQSLQSRILSSMIKDFKDSGILCVMIVRKMFVPVVCAQAFPPPQNLPQRFNTVDVKMPVFFCYNQLLEFS